MLEDPKQQNELPEMQLMETNNEKAKSEESRKEPGMGHLPIHSSDVKYNISCIYT